MFVRDIQCMQHPNVRHNILQANLSWVDGTMSRQLEQKIIIKNPIALIVLATLTLNLCCF